MVHEYKSHLPLVGKGPESQESKFHLPPGGKGAEGQGENIQFRFSRNETKFFVYIIFFFLLKNLFYCYYLMFIKHF